MQCPVHGEEMWGRAGSKHTGPPTQTPTPAAGRAAPSSSSPGPAGRSCLTALTPFNSETTSRTNPESSGGNPTRRELAGSQHAESRSTWLPLPAGPLQRLFQCRPPGGTVSDVTIADTRHEATKTGTTGPETPAPDACVWL